MAFSCHDATAPEAPTPIAASVQAAHVQGWKGIALPPSTPVSVTGGSPPYSYSVTPALPNGLTLNAATGEISGTPQELALTDFTATVTDVAKITASAGFELRITSAVDFNLDATTKVGTVGVSLTVMTTVISGTAPFTVAFSGGALPAGLAFNSATGSISGVPTAASAAATFTLTVTDATGQALSKPVTLTVNRALSLVALSGTFTGNVGVAIATFAPVQGSGGTAPLTYTVNPALPAGLTLDSASGAISGTPTAVGAGTFTMSVVDQVGATGSKGFSLTVSGP